MKIFYKNESGFTIIELLIVMVITLFVLAAATQVMLSMTTQFKQQTRIAQSSIEGGFGLDMLRKDIAAAGFGLPTGIFNAAGSGTVSYDNTDWTIINATYKEVDVTEYPGSMFNSNLVPPKMVMLNSVTGAFNGSDYLVIKSTAVGMDPVAGKFHLLLKDNVKSTWSLTADEGAFDEWRDPNMYGTSMVTVMTTRDNDNLGMILDVDKYFTTDSNTYNFRPLEDADISVVYAISSVNSDGTIATSLRAPFNRVDYYITKEDVPGRCAPGITANTGTGSLYRAQMDHKTGKLDMRFKVLDCVAVMKALLVLDTNKDGIPETYLERDAAYSASAIRKQLQRVDVYLLTHDGGFDASYEYRDEGDDGIIKVGDVDNGITVDFDAKNLIGSQLVQGVEYWKHFRWRVLKVSERPVGRGTF